MSDAIVDAIRQYPGWTMFCLVIGFLAVSSGFGAMLSNIGKRRKS